MTNDPSIGDEHAEVARRERVVRHVLRRVAAAPVVSRVDDRSLIDIASWATPALVAAAAVIILSAVALLRTRERDDRPPTVAAALGVGQPLWQFVATGNVDVWDWMRPARNP
jgi:hypothetical protein